MSVSFSNIKVGDTYSRPELAKLWGYADYHPLARGVVTPKGDNKIILFVTFEKPEYIEQYRDRMENDQLYWEGPTDHFAEDRMINAQRTGDEIHAFCRERDHMDFVYEGKFTVVDCTLNANRPSRFVLRRA